MLYSVLTFIFKVFDSALATIFLLSFNGYKIKEKPVFLGLLPILIVITEFFANWFDIVAIMVSILTSFIFMRILNFKRTTRIRYLWSSVLFYETLMLVNSIVYNIFRIFMNTKIIDLGERTDVYIAVCIISKSILLLITGTYIYIRKRLEYKIENKNILNLLFTALFNIVLIVIQMQVTTFESDFVFTLVMIELFISRLIHYYMYAKLSAKNQLELEYKLLKQKNNSEKQLYMERKEQFEDIARINHDIKNHLMYVGYHIKTLKYEKALDYIESIDRQTNMQSGGIFLSNDALNFIINHKIDEARKRGINVTVHMEDVQDCAVVDFDLSSFLGNILDNAIESAENEMEKHIQIEIYNFSGYQIYSIKNKIGKSVLAQNTKLYSNKKDKKRHGYGMKQIQNVINSYQGHIDIYEKDGYFNVNVLIPREYDIKKKEEYYAADCDM